MNNRRRALERMALTACLLLAAAAPAAAHGQPGQAAGFLSGVRHPISGIDHVLAMIAVGVWGAQLRSPAIWLLPVTFPLVMPATGRIFWRFRRACCSGSRRSFTPQGPTSPSRRKRCTW